MTQETDEQRAAREKEVRASRDGQAAEFRDAIKSALTETNLLLAAEGIQPNIYAVVQAVTEVLAEFVAMEPDRNRRRVLFAEIDKNLHRLVHLRLDVGVKPAKVMN